MRKIKFFFMLSVMLCSLSIPANALTWYEFEQYAKSGSLEKISEVFIRENIAFNAAQEDGTTLLMIAAQYSSPEVVKYMIDNKAEVKTKNNKGWNALMFAARYNSNPEVTKILLDSGANYVSWNNEGFTSLMLAVNGNADQEIIEALIKAGSNVNAQNKGRSVLSMAVSGHSRENIITALINAGADVNAKSINIWYYQDTPVLLTAISGNSSPEIIEAIINASADVNVKDSDGRTALAIELSGKMRPEIMNALVKAGADPNIKDSNGWTVLMRGIYYGAKTEFIASLIAANADVNAKNNTGRTALMIAAEKSGSEVINSLVKAGADVNTSDDKGITPLIIAADNNKNYKVTEALIKAGADINYSLSGWTALRYAANDNSNHEVIEALIKAGADVKKPPVLLFEAAEKNTNPKVLELIIKSGADINYRSILDIDVRAFARKNSNPEVNKWLTGYLDELAKVNSDPIILRTGTGPALFGENFRIGTVYKDFASVCKSLSTHRMNHFNETLRFKANLDDNAFTDNKWRVEIISPNNSNSYIMYFNCNHIPDGNIMIKSQEVYDSFFMREKFNDPSLRERRKIWLNVSEKIKTPEGILELCKPYAPLIIIIKRGDRLSAGFYDDGRSGSFRLVMFSCDNKFLGVPSRQNEDLAYNVMDMSELYDNSPAHIEDYTHNKTANYFLWNDRRAGYSSLVKGSRVTIFDNVISDYVMKNLQ